jgi:phosphoribosyl 1,2-cyclic phosphate phosphodiesterase
MSKTQIIILGCGSSLGSPRIDNYWGNANKNNSKNCRTRCSLFIKYRNLNIIIDTSPDIKQQLLVNKIRKIDAVIYTHEHADQTHGINELRPFYWINKKKIPTYSDSKTSKYLFKCFEYLFKKKNKFYKPILKNKIIEKEFIIRKNLNTIKFTPIIVKHGDIYANGYRFNDIAYISDCSFISKTSLQKLKNIKLLIIDCLKYKKHKTHLNFNQCINYIKKIKAKKTVLTNLHTDIDYSTIEKKLNKISKTIFPAYDGLKLIIN